MRNNSCVVQNTNAINPPNLRKLMKGSKTIRHSGMWSFQVRGNAPVLHFCIALLGLQNFHTYGPGALLRMSNHELLKQLN